MRLKGFIGAAYDSRSSNIEEQRCVNLYPEAIESGTGKEGEVSALIGTPGLLALLSVGVGPTRMVYTDPQNRALVVSGNTLYKLTNPGSGWVSIAVGTLTTSTGPVRIASTVLSNGDCINVLVDGVNSYAYRILSGVETFGSYASFGYSQVNGATHVVFIDGFFIFNKPDSNSFFTSEWGSFSVAPLDFASAEGDPDNIVSLIANNRDLWLINERTTEVFTNSGNADFPFERVSGGVIQIGCVAPHSVAEINGVVFWLGRDKSGQGIVYAAKGYSPQRISTHPIEFQIQSYEIDKIKAATAYTYHSSGHSFYVLNFSTATFVYDLSTGLWHERAYNSGGTLQRQRGAYHSFNPQFGIHMIGDYESSKVYQYSDTTYADDGAAIIRLRSSPHITNDLNKISYNSFEADMEVGVGLDAVQQGDDPKAILDYSDDGGHTWSNEKEAPIGKIGEYKTRVKFRRLGMARDRIFRLRISDPIKVILLGAKIEITGGKA